MRKVARPMAQPSRRDLNLRKTFSRRRFLGVAATLAGGSWIEPLRGATADALRAVSGGGRRSPVVQAQNRHVVKGLEVHHQLLAEMLRDTLTSLTDTPTIAQAWRSLLHRDDVIGLKFNRSGQQIIATTAVVADALISSLVDAGWPADQIVCIEAPPGVEARAGTRRARTGYDSKATDFGSGSDQLASVLNEVTALIDVPYLKTHNIAGMSCALKNLSHGLVKHPARFHDNGCSPFVADIVAIPQIRAKLRLCLVDALRVVYDRGPEATADTISNEGVLMASRDPVATDALGLVLLNDVRRQRNLDPVAPSAENLGYLAAAQQIGLGVARRHEIELLRARTADAVSGSAGASPKSNPNGG